MKTLLALVLVLAAIGAPAALFLLSDSPALELTPAPKAVAAESQLLVKITAKHGIRLIRAELHQGKATSTTAVEQPSNRWTFFKQNLPPASYSLKLLARPSDGFVSGPAKLTVEAVSNDFRGATASKSLDVVVNLLPPRISADSFQHYINQGGAEMVLFTVSGYYTESGVKIGNTRFRSFPVPGAKSDNERFCLFAFPWNAPADSVPMVYASNPAGQEVTARFWYKLTPKKFRQRELELKDDFLEKATSEIDPSGQGELIERFLKINSEVRKQNNATLAALRDQTELRQLWTAPFQQLSNSKVEAFFADVRSYKYKGKKVDEQVHLGFDLSKVKAAPVVASNSGKVVLADRLGIYGNCVVVDHGYGLQSIYAHLSSISVKPGQMVERGGELGRSGATGLAGGDHLHFSMQIDGVQVNPVEWWDPHWIKDRISSKLDGTAIQAAKEKETEEPKNVSHAPSKHRRKKR